MKTKKITKAIMVFLSFLLINGCSKTNQPVNKDVVVEYKVIGDFDHIGIDVFGYTGEEGKQLELKSYDDMFSLLDNGSKKVTFKTEHGHVKFNTSGYNLSTTTGAYTMIISVNGEVKMSKSYEVLPNTDGPTGEIEFDF